MLIQNQTLHGLMLSRCIAFFFAFLVFPLSIRAELYAVVVGIGTHHPRSVAAGVTNLPSPPQDARRFYGILRQTYNVPPHRIKMLLNEQATKRGIVTALRWLASAPQKNDHVVFYFSGHGTQIEDKNGDEADGLDESLVPYDGLPTRLILDDEIHAWRRTIRASRLTLIFDSCHSGDGAKDSFLITKFVQFASRSKNLGKVSNENNGFLRDQNIPSSGLIADISPRWRKLWGLPPNREAPTQSPPTTVFAAATSAQKAIDSGIHEIGSVFTYYFSRALRASPYATPEQITQYIHQAIKKDFQSKKIKNDYLKTMTPNAKGDVEQSIFTKNQQRKQQCLGSFCANFWLVNQKNQTQQQFAPQEEVRFRFRFNQKAYAVVVNIDPKGNKTLLYPDMYYDFLKRSRKQDMYAYAPNITHLLPPKGVKSEALIYVDGSPGQTETVILLATTDPNAIQALRKIPLNDATTRGQTVQSIVQEISKRQKAITKLAVMGRRKCQKEGGHANSPDCAYLKKTPTFLAIWLEFKIAPSR